MSMFKEFLNSGRKEDPEVRKAAELGRSDDTINNKRRRKTSVSVNTAKIAMTIVGVILSVGVIYVIGNFAWKAIQIYLGN